MVKFMKMKWLENGAKGNAHKILDEKPNEKTLRRPRCRWEDNIRVGLRKIRIGGCKLD